jgi:hypothetical protein
MGDKRSDDGVVRFDVFPIADRRFPIADFRTTGLP